jgi:hypothetical protein
MGPLVPLLAVGAGIGYLAFSKPSSATPSATANAAAQATAQANAQGLQAQQFYAAAQALGLSPLDAQNAYSLGLSPQDYINAGLQGSAFGSVNPAGGLGGQAMTPGFSQPFQGGQPATSTSPLDPMYTTQGNLLQWYGPGF